MAYSGAARLARAVMFPVGIMGYGLPTLAVGNLKWPKLSMDWLKKGQ